MNKGPVALQSRGKLGKVRVESKSFQRIVMMIGLKELFSSRILLDQVRRKWIGPFSVETYQEAFDFSKDFGL